MSPVQKHMAANKKKTKQSVLSFEHVKTPVLDVKLFIRRQIKFTLLAFSFLTLCLGIGVIGYHVFAHLDWISSYHNATMILSGMGEIDKMPSNAAKVFSGSYALFSGVVFLSTIAVLFSPVVHRFLHIMHVEEPQDK
ncbi:MAG: hypothetical protein ABIQ02_14895 [Saprospiraceae bacterium]